MLKKTLSLFLMFIATCSFPWASQIALAQEKDAEQEEVDVMDLMDEGGALIREKDFKAAAEVFQKAVDAEPDLPNAWQLLGYTLHMSGDLDKAIEAHKKASEFEETKGIALYNLGCAYSLKEDADKAFEYLNKALTAGFIDMSFFDTDTDLENIRKDDRFKKILARAKNGGREPIDVDVLRGEWTYRSGERAGEEVAKERLVGGPVFDTEKLEIPAGPDEKFVMTYKLKNSKKFTEIDLEIESGPAPEGKALGILKLEEGVLTFCYDPQGLKRPTKFETSAENGFFMFAMERVQSKKADAEETEESTEVEKEDSDKDK